MDLLIDHQPSWRWPATPFADYSMRVSTLTSKEQALGRLSASHNKNKAQHHFLISKTNGEYRCILDLGNPYVLPAMPERSLLVITHLVSFLFLPCHPLVPMYLRATDHLAHPAQAPEVDARAKRKARPDHTTWWEKHPAKHSTCTL